MTPSRRYTVIEAQPQHWTLREDIVHLNHGSFGGCPRVVLEAQQRARDEMESELLRFLAPERELEPKLDAVRERVAAFVGAPRSDIAFVRNATDGCNAVLRSFPLQTGDEILITDHGYNACSNAARFVADRVEGAKVKVASIPFPIRSPQEAVEAIAAALTPKTRLVLVDHKLGSSFAVFGRDAEALEKVSTLLQGGGQRARAEDGDGPPRSGRTAGLYDDRGIGPAADKGPPAFWYPTRKSQERGQTL